MIHSGASASRQQKRMLRVRVLRAEEQLHVQVQGQVHANVQGSAQQQQCAMCKSNAVAVSKGFACEMQRAVICFRKIPAHRSESCNSLRF
jgi:hypothetical protein